MNFRARNRVTKIAGDGEREREGEKWPIKIFAKRRFCNVQRYQHFCFELNKTTKKMMSLYFSSILFFLLIEIGFVRLTLFFMSSVWMDWSNAVKLVKEIWNEIEEKTTKYISFDREGQMVIAHLFSANRCGFRAKSFAW